MACPVSPDLRERIAAALAGGFTTRAAAKRFWRFGGDRGWRVSGGGHGSRDLFGVERLSFSNGDVMLG